MCIRVFYKGCISASSTCSVPVFCLNILILFNNYISLRNNELLTKQIFRFSLCSFFYTDSKWIVFSLAGQCATCYICILCFSCMYNMYHVYRTVCTCVYMCRVVFFLCTGQQGRRIRISMTLRRYLLHFTLVFSPETVVIVVLNLVRLS